MTTKIYQNYSEVPWYRRSIFNIIFMSISVISRGILPLTLITIILAFTGDIYFKKLDSEGNLRHWNKGNKVGVFIILVFNLYVAFVSGNP